MQIWLTVLGPQGGAGVDVAVTAPTDTPLATVLGPLAAAVPLTGQPGAVFCGAQRLDPQRNLLGHPPLVNGALVAFQQPADPLEPTPAPARLLVLSGPDAGGVHLLHGGEVRVGRSADAEVPLDDPDVSRLHCALTLSEDGTATVTDLGSTNGTALNGVPVGSSPLPLPSGSVLRLGESVLRVVADAARPRDDAPAAPPAAGPAAATAGNAQETSTGRGGLLAHWTRRLTPQPESPARPSTPPQGHAPPTVGAPVGTPPATEPSWPDPATVLLAAIEGDPPLWERGAGHRDALTVRLGTAERASGPLSPVTVNLADVGSLGLAGPRDRLLSLARSVLAQLATLHPPSALELVVLAGNRVADWSWLGWLPHLRPTAEQECRLLLGFDVEQTTARVRELTARLADPTPTRRTVVLVDGDPGARLAPAVTRLAAEGPDAGIHLLCLAEAPASSPLSPVADSLAAARAAAPAFDACGTVGLLAGEVATAVRLLLPDGTPGPAATVDGVSPAWAERCARALAPRREDRPGTLAATGSAAPPDSCRLLDVLELPRVTPGALRERWARPRGLPLVLGAGAAGPVTADLADPALPGPLRVTGEPGSGRSELLCTAAAALAAARGPHELSLLLVHGEAEGLRPCVELPHVASVLRATDPVRMRAFAQALRGELKRRTALLAGRTHAEYLRACPEPGADHGTGHGAGDDDPAAPAMRAAGSGSLPYLVVLADDLHHLLAPALGATGRPAAGSVVRALAAVAEEGPPLGVHLMTAGDTAPGSTAPLGGPPAGLCVALTGPPAGRAELRSAGGPVTRFQAGRVTGRIPRTSTLRPAVAPLDWARAGDPPPRRPVRELGNGPTDVALLASAAARAARAGHADTATTASLV